MISGAFVVYDNKPGYFIGPMVAWRDPLSSVRRVVDGQQRLTTIAIFFAVLRDEFRGLGHNSLAQGIHRYLEKPNRNNELEYTLETEVESGYLNHAIFSDPPNLDFLPQGDEEKALHQGVSLIRRLISGEVEKRIAAPVEWLTHVRDKLLNLKVIWVEHGDEDDAYILFETLNSRGKDLEVVDLLKNLLFNKLRSQGNRQSDAVRDTWNTMRGVIEDAGSPSLNVNRFILHWWISQEPYIAERKLFRAIKGEVRTRPQARTRLNSLREDVDFYRYALDPDSRQWPIEEAEARLSLEALAVFRILQPAPLLLSLIRARLGSELRLGTKPLITTLQTIERYHFQYTVISQLSSSGGVSEMYAKAARDLYHSRSSQQRANVLKEFRQKLIDRAPEREQFVVDFSNRFVLTDSVTRDSKLVRYVLCTILRHQHPETNLDYLTVEHILPQSAIGYEGIDESVVGSIGNLLLVNNDVNRRLGSKPFSSKLAVLSSEGLPFDIGGVLDRSSWGPSEINRRAKMLGELAYGVVWKLPA
jgi:Protein of unknown function DUF262/Protein of unknown function (DUF1524)